MAGAGEVRADALLAAYLFYGEEEFLAEEFVSGLKNALASSAGGECPLTRLDLDEWKWRDIIDTGRTAPFLFEPWRAIVVRFPERRPGSDKGRARASEADGEDEKGAKFLSVTDQKILRDYFADPPSKTVLVVIKAGRTRKDDPVVRFFQSLPKASVAVLEMKPLGPPALMRRADEKARSLGKTLTEGAKKRLFEIIGQDLRLMLNEVGKLAVYVGDRKGIEEEDVSQATAWQRSFQAYDLDDALAAADFAKGVTILNDLFAEGEKPEVIVGRLAGFFRNVLAAQTWLREKSRTKEEIFQTFFPHIQKSWGGFYADKSRQFFGAVEGLSVSGLNALLGNLRRLDKRIKSSSTRDIGEKILLEAFLREYCLARKKRTIISSEGP